MIHSIAGWLLKHRHRRGATRLLGLVLTVLPTTRSHYGPRMRVRRRDFTNWASIWGLYGETLRDVIEVLPRDSMFLDIGANTGIYSLVAARHLNDGYVFCFEPNPMIYGDLVANIRLNASTNLFPFNAAVGTHSEISTLVFDAHHSGGGFLAGKDGSSRGVPVLVIHLGDMTVIDKVASERILLCKIDVEGAEADVLASLDQSGLLKKVDAVYIEISRQNLARFGTNVEAIYSVLLAHGYRPLIGCESMVDGDELFCRRSSPLWPALASVVGTVTEP